MRPKPFAQDVASMRAERRIVTVLFVDIAGSTAITETLDPEDVRDLVGGALAIVISHVDELGGTVKDLAGDGVLALFGAPVAHEDDAERAVLCGLRSVRSNQALRSGRRTNLGGVRLRDTGRHRDGGSGGPGPVGTGSRIEYGATGDAVNVAARLQSLTPPGTVLVGEMTRSMVEHRFVWGPTTNCALKGRTATVKAAPALSAEPAAFRSRRCRSRSAT